MTVRSEQTVSERLPPPRSRCPDATRGAQSGLIIMPMIRRGMPMPVRMVSSPPMEPKNNGRWSYDPSTTGPIHVLVIAHPNVFGAVPSVIVRGVGHVARRWGSWCWRRWWYLAGCHSWSLGIRCGCGRLRPSVPRLNRSRSITRLRLVYRGVLRITRLRLIRRRTWRISRLRLISWGKGRWLLLHAA
jgi:hypothetical protein